VPNASPNGQVVAQNPAAGAKAKKGSTVRINVSNGAGGGTTTGATTTGATTTRPATTTTATPAPPKNVTVPNLVGQQLAPAARQLGGLGLLASIQYVPSDQPLGTVVAQSPTSGRTVKQRSHVTLNLSTGPGTKPQKTIPNVVGQTLDGAVARIQGAGLRTIFLKLPVTDRTQAGKIVEQTPPAGGSAPQNAQVLIYLGAFRG
jgi:serine/threonine-protein kinase